MSVQRNTWDELLSVSIRASLGVVFVVSASLKLADIEGFSVVVQQFGIGHELSVTTAVALGFAELGLGLLLVAGLHEPLVVRATILLLASFALIVALPLLQGREIACGCFGRGEPLTWWTVARQFVLAGACWWLMGVRRGRRPGDHAELSMGEEQRAIPAKATPVGVWKLGVMLLLTVGIGTSVMALSAAPEVLTASEVITKSVLSDQTRSVGEYVDWSPLSTPTERYIVCFVASGHPSSDLARAFWLHFAQEASPDHMVYVYEMDEHHEVFDEFEVHRVPVSFFVRDGVIAYRRTGFSLSWWAELRALAWRFLENIDFEIVDREGVLQRGQRAVDVVLLDESGRARGLLERSTATVVYVVSPSCSVCSQVTPIARRLERSIPDGASWVSLVLGATEASAFEDGLRELERLEGADLSHIPRSVSLLEAFRYAKGENLPGEVLYDLDRVAERALGIWGLPAIFVVDERGFVRSAHIVGVGKMPRSGPPFAETLLTDIADVVGGQADGAEHEDGERR